MSKHMYFSLDSDMLSNLADLDVFLENNPEATDKDIISAFKNSKSSAVARRPQIYRKYLDIAKDKNSPMRFLVTQTAWMESNHIPSVNGFISKYCYTPKIKYLLQDKVNNKIEKLARLYCKKYKNTHGEEKPAPMSSKYSAAKRDLSPTNDAYIMAEATIYGACVLTENLKDYIHMEEKHEKGRTILVGDNKRALGIMELNKMNGYEIEYDENFKTIPKPWAADNLGRFLDDLENFRGHFSEDSLYEEAQTEM